ncbi:MAG: hypothetical protein LBD35_06660 [Prevotellaceae bacterium]|jgi:hypothetical protein|nr:hypothetical protein [Prevotellaceae bacterium]
MKTQDINTDEIFFSDDELNAMASFAAFIDDNAVCGEENRSEADEYDRELFDELRDYGNEIEKVFGKDNFMDDMALFDKIFASALRQYGAREREKDILAPAVGEVSSPDSASNEADGNDRKAVNG